MTTCNSGWKESVMRDCKHGQLGRSCEICDLKKEFMKCYRSKLKSDVIAVAKAFVRKHHYKEWE